MGAPSKDIVRTEAKEKGGGPAQYYCRKHRRFGRALFCLSEYEVNPGHMPSSLFGGKKLIRLNIEWGNVLPPARRSINAVIPSRDATPRPSPPSCPPRLSLR